MKILPVVKEIRNDVTLSSYKLKKATATGYNIALRAAKMYNHGKFKKYCNITRSVSSKVAKETSKKELPYVAGAVGLLIPIPLMSPILMGLGFLARMSSNSGANIMYDSMSQAHLVKINSTV